MTILLPDLPRKKDEQIKELRRFLNVATLSVFARRDMAVSFRSSSKDLSEANIIKANIMVQLATHITLKRDVPKYNKKKFEDAVEYVLALTKEHERFLGLIQNAFEEAGVVFVVLPNLPGSNINGATKKVGDKIMLMVNDRRLYSDSFWFTLFHEIGHIINGDFGISFDKEKGAQEIAADQYAENRLSPSGDYQKFVAKKNFSVSSIRLFAEQIDRDPGIVLGRLQNDKYVRYDDRSMNPLRRKYKVRSA